ncbi:MAG TPA: TrkA family potassium uptake protein [Pilimelia sp.]|nr:TrkA family potassium uptake protein [Pilimelia sp.]
MRSLIAGAGRFGAQVAEALSALGHDVTLIETDDDRVVELGGRTNASILPGDACEPAVLEEAGVLRADMLVAATGDDEDNLVISLLAKRQFAVPRVAARINDPENGWLFDQRWGVDVAIPAAAPLISLIEEATDTTDTVALMRLSKAGVNVIETAITSASRAAGRTLGEIPLPPGTVVATAVRGGRPIVPDAGFRLRPGDELLVVSETARAEDIHATFQ